MRLMVAKENYEKLADYGFKKKGSTYKALIYENYEYDTQIYVYVDEVSGIVSIQVEGGYDLDNGLYLETYCEVELDFLAELIHDGIVGTGEY